MRPRRDIQEASIPPTSAARKPSPRQTVVADVSEDTSRWLACRAGTTGEVIDYLVAFYLTHKGKV